MSESIKYIDLLIECAPIKGKKTKLVRKETRIFFPCLILPNCGEDIFVLAIMIKRFSIYIIITLIASGVKSPLSENCDIRECKYASGVLKEYTSVSMSADSYNRD